MHKFVSILLLSMLICVPGLFGAPFDMSTKGTVTIPTSFEANPIPGRDGADDDSVYYHQGFEDGWQGWAGVDLTAVQSQWKLTDDDFAFEENSWWCGKEEFEGYGNHWLMFMITPSLNLTDYRGDMITLRFKMWHEIEAAAGADEFGYDGWDAANVWISTDGGEEWEVLAPEMPAYDSEDLFSFGDIWNYGHGIPGWNDVRDEWTDVEFDISDYDAFEDVKIRFTFCSDDAWSAEDGEDARGILIDNIEITAEDAVVFANNGDEEGDAEEMEFGTGPSDGNYWEISDAESNDGDFSAHWPITLDSRQNPLTTVGLDIPSEPWYTYFDFYIRCDTREDVNENGNLLDYYFIEISEDSVEWEDVIYDYGREYTDQQGNVVYSWKDHFHYYGPDTTYNEVIEWKQKLNLTQFGGETVWLRWLPITDTIEADPEGSGIWIDDFKLNITARRQYDIEMSWVDIPYPTATDITSSCWLQIRNAGMAGINQVRQYYDIDGGQSLPITPFRSLESDSTRKISFRMNTDGPFAYPYGGVVDVNVRADAADDEDLRNNMVTENIVIYPDAVWALGYDNRSSEFFFRFDEGYGAAVMFTPEDDGIEESFDLNAIRVNWFHPQMQQAETMMYILEDDGGEPGDEIHSENIVVTADDYIDPEAYPLNSMVINLTEVQELKEMQDDFWVYFEMPDGDNFPAVTGSEDQRGEEFIGTGHYYRYDGADSLAQMDAQFMINPVIMPAGFELTLLTFGKEELDFETIAVDSTKILQACLMNGGTNDVVIEGFEVANDMGEIFEVVPDGWDLPLTLEIGDYQFINIEFTPDDEVEYMADINVTSNSDAPASLTVIGVGDRGAGVPENGNDIPLEYELGKAYPNPFNSTTVIPFALPTQDQVKVAIYDLSGRLVANIADGTFAAGHHQITFDAANLTTGVYIYELTTPGFNAYSKVVLVK